VRPDPLATLLNDPSVTEVIVNGPHEVWVERRGRLQRASLRFDDADALRDACVRLAARAGRRLDDAQPMVDARLADGSRLNVVLPPLAPDGPLLTLRRFAPRPFTLAELVALGSLTDADAALLDACVLARLSVVISGGTSSGKTSLLGALAARIDAASASSPSRMPPSCASTVRPSRASRRAVRVSRAGGRSGSASWCATRSACAPTAWSSARCAAARRSTCCRP
jgi:Flp pilus assembly CpaF family ATPase